MRAFFSTLLFVLAGLGLGTPAIAQAGVGTTPHFVAPGEFAVGVEPGLILSNGAGVGANVKYTQGLNELMNLTGIIGTSGGPRKFRFGSNLTFDFFPDVEGQPGIGVAASGLYYRLADTGLLEVQAIPYIHKTFVSQKNEVEPYFAIPFGWQFSDGQYQGTSQVVVGSMFQSTPKIRYNIEFGIAVNHSESEISAGVTYFH